MIGENLGTMVLPVPLSPAKRTAMPSPRLLRRRNPHVSYTLLR